MMPDKKQKKHTHLIIQGDFKYMLANNFIWLVKQGNAKEIEKTLGSSDFIERNKLIQDVIDLKLSASLLNLSLKFEATGLRRSVQKYLIEFGA